MSADRIEIIETFEYDKFKYIGANREINEKHILALMESINKKNMLSIQPCLISSDDEIIDGQHRIEAARRLKISFFYIVADILSHEDILSLNNVKLGWGIMDYINFYTVKKMRSYQLLTKYIMKYPKIPLHKILILISDTGVNIKADVKNGNLNARNYENVDSMVEIINDFKNVTVHCNDTFFFDAVWELFMGKSTYGFGKKDDSFKYDHKLFLENIRTNNINFDELVSNMCGYPVNSRNIIDAVKRVQFFKEIYQNQ